MFQHGVLLLAVVGGCSQAIASYIPANCGEALRNGGRDGIYKIKLNEQLEPFYVYCKADSEGGEAWTIIQRRQDGTVNFYRDWKDYQAGFGNLAREFFIGLDNLHALTQTTLHELWVQLEDFDMQTRYAKYDAFGIGNEKQGYALNILGNYSGNAGDSLEIEQGNKFTTKDVHNDPTKDNCAVTYTGAWWYNNCHWSNLNGAYLKGEFSKDKFAQGVVWRTWRGYYYSLKYTHMAIRPVKYNIANE